MVQHLLVHGCKTSLADILRREQTNERTDKLFDSLPIMLLVLPVVGRGQPLEDLPEPLAPHRLRVLGGDHEVGVQVVGH